MFNLFRMDMRRLVRSRSFYIVLAVTAALIMMIILLVVKMSEPETLEAMEATGMVTTDGDSQQIGEEIRAMSQLEFACESMNSSFLLMMTGIGMALFANSDFSSGYIKNICFARPRRRDYVLSKVLVAGIYSGILLILGLLISLICPVLFGLHLTADPALDILKFVFWLWPPLWAFGLMALSLVLLTRSSALGITLSVLSGSGMIYSFLQVLCRQFDLPDVSQYLLSSVTASQCVPMLGAEQMTMILACTLGWAAVYGIGSLLMMEKRDI